MLLHDLGEQLDLLRLPIFRDDAVLLTDEHLDLVLDEAQALGLENVLYFLGDINSLHNKGPYQMLEL